MATKREHKRLTAIRFLRLGLDLSEQYIAETARIARPRYRRIERGHVTPEPRELLDIIAAFGPGCATLVPLVEDFAEALALARDMDNDCIREGAKATAEWSDQKVQS